VHKNTFKNPLKMSFFQTPYIRAISRGADKSLASPIFLFAAQRKEFSLDGLKKLEQ
jgi:hypothetical protein